MAARARLAPLVRFLLVDGFLLLMLVALIVGFSLALPHTFPTAFNVRSLLSDKSVVAFGALGVLVPMAANQFDLSVGFAIGLAHILAVGLQSKEGLPWGAAVVVVLLLGIVIGLVNGLLVAWMQVDSFIATLGLGTVLYGISSWYTNGEQVVGFLPSAFLKISSTVGGIPTPALYALGASVVLWFAFEYLPVGRRLYVLGFNPRAAELTGISARRYVPCAFAASGFLAACAGIILAAQLQVGQISVGPDFLLPSFAAVLLGATTIRRGRVNVWGTIVAVLVLAVAVSGLQQLGAQFWVEPLFNGSMLVLAVALAGYAARRRILTRAAPAATAAGNDEATASTAAVR